MYQLSASELLEVKLPDIAIEAERTLLLERDTIADFANRSRFRSSFASCNRQAKIYNLRFFHGVLAQLVERLNGIEEVRGSNPLGSRPSLEAQRWAKVCHAEVE